LDSSHTPFNPMVNIDKKLDRQFWQSELPDRKNQLSILYVNPSKVSYWSYFLSSNLLILIYYTLKFLFICI